jgi:hypothetical protein
MTNVPTWMISEISIWCFRRIIGLSVKSLYIDEELALYEL